MAELTEEQRVEVNSEAMSDLSNIREPIAITRPELKAAVDALDSFLQSNAAAINNALPAAAKAGLTTQQKARLLKYVITKRYIVEA